MSEYPIIFLWAHPRSMSTAIERVMRERGDLHCLHEPFLHYYYLHRSDKKLPHFTAETGHPDSYETTRDRILELARQQPVFAKDMSYYVLPDLLADHEFCSRITHTFLIRDPLRAILSYYKLDPNLAQREVGIEAQWQHYQALAEQGIKAPVICAESVQQNPEKIMSAYWQLTGLEHKAQALHWNTDSTPKDWDYVQGWHQQVSQSSSIRQETPEHAQQIREEFEQLAEQQPQLNDYLAYHLPAYQAMKERAIS